jgi:uncharacterized membrane protein YfcA
MTSALTAIGALLIGCSIGMVGIGGIFLIPLLFFVERLPIQEAIGTALLTFIFTGITGTLAYARHGAIDWRLAILTSVGSLLLGPIGARVSVALPEAVVKLIFAAFLAFVGIHTLLRMVRPDEIVRKDRLASEFNNLALIGCGAAVGLGSGLTGVGGPAILVPLLVFLGLPVQIAVGVSQVNQIAASASGAFGHLLFGRINVGLAAVLTLFEIVGVCVGAQINRRAGPGKLRPAVAALCIVVAAWTVYGLLLPTYS